MGKPKGHSARGQGDGRSLSDQVRRRDWDPDKRLAAWELDRVVAGWSVFYGTYTRLFFAIAAWPAPDSIVLEARDVEELRSLIGEAETAYLHQQGMRP